MAMFGARPGISGPGSAQCGLQYGGELGIDANPSGNSALRLETKITEFGEDGGPIQRFRQWPPKIATWTVSGIARDGSGNILVSCGIDLFMYGSNQYLQSTTTDITGFYSFTLPTNGPVFIRAVNNPLDPVPLAGTTLALNPV